MSNKKELKKQKWMREMSEEFNRITPWMKGKIDWDTAIYLFNCKTSPITAAIKLHQPHCSVPNACGCVPF
jgi:hypothetical protein